MVTITRHKMMLHYTGLFDFDGLYALIIDWAKNYGYIWYEIDYKHKVPSPRGAEQEFKWLMHKEVTEMVSFDIRFEVHIWDLVELEVEVGGKKKTLTSGKIYIWMFPDITFDWQKKFTGSTFRRKLFDVYYKKVAKKRLDNVYAEQILYRMYDLQALIKQFFDLQSKRHAYKDYLKES